jgi:hypothetical protein
MKRRDDASGLTMTDHLRLTPPTIRATALAARKAVREAAPAATEIAYQSKPPRLKGAMWKLARYVVGDTDVAGIGVTATHVHVYFYRGAELDDGSGLLTGRGKTMRSVKVSTPRDAASPELKRLLRRAFELG